MTTVHMDVSVPDINEIKRIINEWFLVAPDVSVVAAIDGAEDRYDFAPETLAELEQHFKAYLCWLWLQAAKQRAAWLM
jgi:hypothetical protein